MKEEEEEEKVILDARKRTKMETEKYVVAADSVLK